MHLHLGNVDWKLVIMLAIGTSTGAGLALFILAKFDREILEKFLLPIILITALMRTVVLLK